MKIEKIVINNFRQYHGVNTIDLATNDRKNIIIIGGKNGYGKTNFLLSLVWCLYGDDISKIDENFRREIQKAGNYPKFLKESLNWDASKDGNNKFSVTIELSQIELPETSEYPPETKFKCTIKREFDATFANEEFEINIHNLKKSLFNDEDYKKEFVNDYLIPIEAAKFVFFDAEKIASWAELSTREEGSVLNDALGKILGLDIYEGLIKDLEIYINDLRRESATTNLKQQITADENGILLHDEKIQDFENEIIKKDLTINELKLKIQEYEKYLGANSTKNNGIFNGEQLYQRKDEIEKSLYEHQNNFNQISEVIPFAILYGILEETTSHLSLQKRRCDNSRKAS